MTGPAFSFDSTLGAAFIGFTLALVLYGVTCLQAILYFHKCTKDSLIMRSLVVILWTLDNLHTILVSHGMYIILVTYHADPMKAVAAPPWSFSAQVYVTVVSNLLVRTVFSQRIYILGRGKPWIRPVVAVVMFLSLYVVATGIVFGTESIKVKTWQGIHNYAWSMYSGYGAEMVADLIIAITMSILLVRLRTGLKSSDSLVQTFVMYSINTGLMTTICVFLSLITFLTMPDTLAFLACYFVLSKLYVNSLLGTLNARSKMKPRKAANAPKQLIHTNSDRTESSRTDSTSGNTRKATSVGYDDSSGQSDGIGMLTSVFALYTEPGIVSEMAEEELRVYQRERQKDVRAPSEASVGASLVDLV